MNSTNSVSSVSTINMRAIIWNLLSQWKVVLVVAILVALLVPGMKYAKDLKDYETSLRSQKEVDKQESLSSDEKIAAILEPLSASDKSDVEFVLKEKEWIRKEKAYLNTSILMREDPTNQRLLRIHYNVTAAEQGKMTALTYGYYSQLYQEETLVKLGEVIDPTLDTKYIGELVWCDTGRLNNIETETTDMVMEFGIVIPKNADAEAVEQALTSCLTKYSDELAKTVGTNSISLLTTADYTRYNADAVNNRTNITYAIYNVQNNIKNGATSLSDEAKAAIEAIDAIQSTEESVDENKEAEPAPTPAPVAPHFRKKYAALGFILGAMLYAFIYALMMMLKGNMTSSTDMGYYTGSRLIGEIYNKSEHSGLSKLLHSGIVDKYRYRGKLDEVKQVDKTVSTIEAVSKHAETDKLSMLCMPGLSESLQNVIKRIVSCAGDKGVTIDTINLNEVIDENQLTAIEKGIIVGSNSSKASEVACLSALCREYGVKSLGDVYIQEI